MACQRLSRRPKQRSTVSPKGMPYLVVTVSPEGVVAIAVESKDEARVLALKKSLRVLLEDDRAEQLS